MRHIHVHLRDASEAQVTWKQFLRKLETGEWKYNGTPTPGQPVYYVTQGTKKKGVHNFVGRTVMVSIMMTPEEAKAAKEEEDAKQIAYYRSLRELQKKNTPKDAPGRRDFFVRCKRGGEYEDHGRDENEGKPGGDHWTVQQAEAWLRAYTTNGKLDPDDGGAPFVCEIVHWA